MVTSWSRFSGCSSDSTVPSGQRGKSLVGRCEDSERTLALQRLDRDRLPSTAATSVSKEPAATAVSTMSAWWLSA